MARIRLITFDATNTLFRVRGSVGEIYCQVALKYGIKMDAKVVDECFKAAFKRYNDEFPNFGAKAGLSSQKWWQDVIGCSLNQLIPTETLENMSSYLYAEFINKGNWEIYKDTVPVLKSFQNRRIKLGVVSNFDERLSLIMRNLDLDKYFDFILPSRQTKWYKPMKQIFNHAALMVDKCPPSQVIHVGDNFELDYLAALHAGLDGYLLLRQPTNDKINQLLSKKVPRHKIIHNLKELTCLL